jgi:RNA polymerase sigma-70 factor (ECF subfamily)
MGAIRDSAVSGSSMVELTEPVSPRSAGSGSTTMSRDSPSTRTGPAATVEPVHPGDRGAIALDAVMDRYARGEDAAFAEVYRRGATRVRGFLLRLGGDLALADDLTQETFLRVQRARGAFAPAAPALPWLLAIARNALRDHVRRVQAYAAATNRAELRHGADRREASPDTRGDEVLAAREMLDVVRAALDRMPVPQREAFVLLRFEGLSVGQAAQVLGATESAVKIRAFRACESLRACLRAAGEEGR